MERIVEQGLLFDFYGELLTEHQRKIYGEAVSEDLSLGELSEEYGVSRQGIHDLIRRCDKIMQDYEDKLHLIEKYQRTKDTATIISKMAEQDGLTEIKALSDQILQEL